MLSTSKTTKTAADASGTIDPVEYFYSGTTGQMTRVKYTNEVYAKLNGSNVEVWWGEKGGALSKIIDTSSVSLTTTERFRFEVAPAAQFRYDDITIFSDGVKSMTTFTHNNANEQTAMTVDGTTTNFAYDAWGRMTSRTRGSLTANYAWRYGSFLSNVTSDFPGEASEVDYVYDGLQNRRLKLVNGTDYTWTRYDANGSALADYSNGASYWDIGGRERSFHGGAEIAGSSPHTGTPSYYLQNHLGSIMATTDASKDIVASYQYTPYGEFLSETTTGDHATFGYTGHRLDRELNHYYAKYRYYNPTTMRWLKRDPLGMVDGPNVYEYVISNPVSYFDPEGLACGPGDGIGDDIIPDSCPPIFGTTFTSCCERHDACYRCKGHNDGNTRRECDKEFRTCMRDLCNEEGRFKRRTCKMCSRIYYRAVRLFGKIPFWLGRRGCNECKS